MNKNHDWCPHYEYDLWDTPLARGITSDLWPYIQWPIVYTCCNKCLPKYIEHVKMLKLKKELLR